MYSMNRTFWAGLCLAIALTATAAADVNLEWRPGAATVDVGDFVDIGLYGVYDGTGDDAIANMRAVLDWDPAMLALVDVVSPEYGWDTSGFPAGDYDGLNDSFLDGEALYKAYAVFGDSAVTTSGGLLLTTIRFEALALTPNTDVAILAPGALGLPLSDTQIVSGQTSGLDITGSVGVAHIEIIPEPATALLFAGAVLMFRRRR